ncbi:MAG TPA: winged helix-turn-helix domain-containing protein [Terriglobales bacterium]
MNIAEEEVITAGATRLYPERLELAVGARTVRITKQQSDIMRIMLARAGRVATRAMLLEAINGVDNHRQRRNIDVQLGRLRQRLGRSAAGSLECVRQAGYRWNPEVTSCQ